MKLIKLFLTICIIKQSICDETVEVSLKQGGLVGKVEKTLYKKQDYVSFRGVPFAEAPIGELRFQVSIKVLYESRQTYK